MTYTEAKDILDQRVNWRNSGAFILSSENTTTESGRYFQDEHSAITLDNIKACQPNTVISDGEFDTYLTQLRHAVILQVLADVYGSESEVTENELNCNVGVFDNAISLRMMVVVAELIITSTRSNMTERLTKGFIQQLHFDLNGNYGQNLNPNFPRAEGFGKKYQDSIGSIKRKLSKHVKFKSITAGAYGNYKGYLSVNEFYKN
ncbi:MAG: hypothetical protein AAF039_12830 [Bacteroidota bacterium]